jgi:general secretion pathway protein F
MTAFRYRAATATGALKTGTLEGRSVADVLEQVRRLDLRPIEAVQVKAMQAARTSRPLSRTLLAKSFGELAVILDAGVPMDRAIALLVEDIEGARDRAAFEAVHRSVREGRPLSRALADAGPAFPTMAAAMTSAGEADGRPAAALAKLSQTLERAQALQSTLVSAMIYPAMLLVIAAGVIALMLFWVVPQFENLFSDAGASLPTTTRVVLAISHFARRYWAAVLAVLAAAVFAASRVIRRPGARLWFDRSVLRVPQVGPLVSMAESARFVRILASLVEGGVALPDTLAIARRSLGNTYIAAAIDRVAKGLREGEGLTEPLAATGVLPKLAISYLRTGEQTAQLPLMLDRLADALDRDVRVRVERLIGILTPLITVVMGGIVATVIASIMTAILGFDDLALAR